MKCKGIICMVAICFLMTGCASRNTEDILEIDMQFPYKNQSTFLPQKHFEGAMQKPQSKQLHCKEHVQQNDNSKKTFITVEGQERVLPYEENHRMVYTSTETGKPISNISHKLTLN